MHMTNSRQVETHTPEQPSKVAAETESFWDRYDLYVLAVIAMGVAWFRRYSIDDAYISYRYAQNLVDGHGLVFNIGEYVEGYTNFLWTLWIALGIKVGLSAELTAYLGSVPAIGFTVYATMRIGRLIGSITVARIAGGLVATNAAFLSFGSSGLETMFQTALLTALLWIVLAHRDRDFRPGVVAGLSALAALAFLTRMDSAVPVAVIALTWAWWRLRDGSPLPAVAARVAGIAAIPVAATIPWMLWRSNTYGSLVPNTLAAKESSTAYLMGAIFLAMFVVSYLWFGPLIAIAVTAKRWVRDRTSVMLFAIVATWCLYVIYAGGDWMDWRFLVAVMPPMMLLAAKATVLIPRKNLAYAGVALAMIGGVAHNWFYPPTANVDGLSTLRLLTDNAPPNWITEGKALGEYFPGGLASDEQVTIAVVAAGAIPYFSGLPTIDMIGLTDAWIAHNAPEIDYESGIPKPGHVKMTTMDYLRERGVNLVIGLPVTVKPDELLDEYALDDPIFHTLFHEATFDYEELGPAPRFVTIPVDGELMLTLLLEPSPLVDAYIEDGTFTVVPIVPAGDADE